MASAINLFFSSTETYSEKENVQHFLIQGITDGCVVSV